MSPPVGIQIGLELTNLVAPLTKAAFKLGSLAIHEAVQRAGSDQLTEEKLAIVLGRHWIDPIISEHFRGIVAQCGQTALSRCMKELILESGAGPTVAQAIAGKDNAAPLLSMIIQLSFLSWSHEHQSLGQALTQIVDESLREGKQPAEHGLNYVLLLGTISSCQQQTAAFSWEILYRAVSEKLTLGSNNNNAGGKARKRRKLTASPTQSQAISDRAIPYVVLRGLIQALSSLQRFPETYLLEISSDRGISSIVLWCYHILGLSVVVELEHKVYFGDSPYLVMISCCGQHKTTASMLIRDPEPIPLFILSKADLDPHLEAERRAHARGFLKTVLETHGYKELDFLTYSRWLLHNCLKHFDHCLDKISDLNTTAPSSRVGNQAPNDNACSTHKETKSPVKFRSHELRNDIKSAICFLVDLHDGALSTSQGSEHPPPAVRKRGGFSSISGVAALCLVYAFARIRNREDVDLLPLSLDVFERFKLEEFQITRGSGSQFRGPIPNTVDCFNLICRLLIGGRHSPEGLENTSLISDRGWSIFFTAMDAVDPAEAASDRLIVKPGVPSKDGVRKGRIIDGMTGLTISSTQTVDLGSDLELWPGVWTSELAGTHVGYWGQNAFNVVQTYDWAHGSKGCKKWRLGFREKHDICMRFDVLTSCSCSPDSFDIDERRLIDEIVLPTKTKDKSSVKQYTLNYPKERSEMKKTPERVFSCNDVWYFFFTEGGAARWLGLDGLWQVDTQRTGFLRGPGCCVNCAISARLPTPAFVLL